MYLEKHRESVFALTLDPGSDLGLSERADTPVFRKA